MVEEMKVMIEALINWFKSFLALINDFVAGFNKDYNINDFEPSQYPGA